jgi:tRNA ligase
MKIGESLAEAVRRAVAGIVKVLGLPFPSEEKIAEGLNAIERYTPELRKPDERRNKGDPTLYYALLLELDLFEYLDNILSSVDHIAEELQQAWGLLKSGNRVTKRPHVTIIHKNNVDINRALWNRCAALHGAAVNSPMFRATLGKIVWNGRAMAITVNDLTLEDAGAVKDQGEEFLSNLPAELADKMHITVGTATPGIPAVEAMEMVIDWNRGSKGVIRQSLDDTVVQGQIKGLIA